MTRFVLLSLATLVACNEDPSDEPHDDNDLKVLFSDAPLDGCVPMQIKLSKSISGATIYYTLDGSEPTATSAAYSDSLVLNVPGETTVRARAVLPDGRESPIAEQTYHLSPLTHVRPMFSHIPGTYTDDFELEITTHDGEGTIYYTLDGSEPSAISSVYTGPIPIAGDGSVVTVKAVVENPPRVTLGDVQEATYRVDYDFDSTLQTGMTLEDAQAAIIGNWFGYTLGPPFASFSGVDLSFATGVYTARGTFLPLETQQNTCGPAPEYYAFDEKERTRDSNRTFQLLSLEGDSPGGARGTMSFWGEICYQVCCHGEIVCYPGFEEGDVRHLLLSQDSNYMTFTLGNSDGGYHLFRY